MKKRILLIAVFSVNAAFLTGCGRSPEVTAALKELYKPRPYTDVSSDPWYNFSSFTNTIWKTKIKVAVADIKQYTNKRDLNLLPPRYFDPVEPKYYPLGVDSCIISVLPVGTRFRIERLMKDNGVWGGVRVAGTLLDETNSQTIVYLNPLLLGENYFIDTGSSRCTNWIVNPDMLAPDRDVVQLMPGDETPNAGYEKGYGNGKEAAISAPNAQVRIYGRNPWRGDNDPRRWAVKLHGEDYAAAYELGYNKGFQEYSKKNARTHLINS